MPEAPGRSVLICRMISPHSSFSACAAGGAALGNLVRAHHFVGDLNVVYAALRIWQEKLAGAPIPFAAIRTPAPLPIPGTDVIVETWVYRPPRWRRRRLQGRAMPPLYQHTLDGTLPKLQSSHQKRLT